MKWHFPGPWSRDSVGYTVRGEAIIDMEGAHLDIISYSVWLEGKIGE